MDTIYLKKRARALDGHLWVLSDEIHGSVKRLKPGELVEIKDKNEKFIGIGYLNPLSYITARILTRQREEIDRNFFEKRIKEAILRRKRMFPGESSFRAVNSEGDFLPGLIIDKYSNWVVIQSLTQGMERFIQVICEIIDQILKVETIFIKNDSPLRTIEGLELKTEIFKGSSEPLPVINEGDLKLLVDPVSGQKTGFYLDQRENRLIFSSLISGGKGLDLFCYTGAWGLHLAKKGAFVTFVDNSQKALQLARENAKLNHILQNCDFVKEDAFKFLTELTKKNEEKYDFIILDPPAFVKSRAKLNEGLKGYRFINASAMRLLKKGGILATSSCSHHMSREVFFDVLKRASRDSGRTVRLIYSGSQSRDHPILLQVPETEYLKCAILEII